MTNAARLAGSRIAQLLAPVAGSQGAVRALLRVKPRRRVLLFSLALLGIGVIGYQTLIASLRPAPAPFHLPWPALAFGFFLAEAKVIDIHFRRETHSLTLSEIPTVVGLYFVDPRAYVMSALLGAGAALVMLRQPPLKIAFNMGQYLVVAVITLVIFSAAPETGAAPALIQWLATFSATIASSAVSAVLIAVVITLSGAAPQVQRLPQMLQVGAAVAASNTSLALLAVAILWVNPAAIWLLTIPVLTLFVAYQAYLSERQKHDRLELLYESSQIFQRTPEMDSAMVSLVEHLRVMFGCDRGELLLLDDSGAILRTMVGPNDDREVMASVRPDAALWVALEKAQRPFVYEPAAEDVGGQALLYRQAMVSPMRGEKGLMGAIIVSDRTTNGEPYSPEELRLFETVATQATVALQNGQLEQSLAELSRLKEELHHQAYHDPMTGLANRLLFIDLVEEAVHSSADEQVCAVLFLDLDDFKIVNDALGHTAGDMLLITVARRIEDSLRHRDVAARLGGDEFAVLVRDGQSVSDAERVAERILTSLRAPLQLGAQQIFVNASIGIAAPHDPDQPASELLRDADVAMYTAKAAGKGRISIFEPQMHTAVIERHELSRELSRAVGRDDIFVHYQPIVSLETGRVEGLEALARWRHPTRGDVPPEAFISLAEESGTIIPLGRKVLTQACEQVARWSRLPGMKQPPFISVNLSAFQVQEPGFVLEVENVLHATGLHPRQLVLEVTETAMVRDMGATIRKLEELRQEGVRIALDDFGTGYSSLGYLRRFPVDMLKVAREFVGVPDTSSDEWVFAYAIVALGQALGLAVIAEGIEKPGQVERLREAGCPYGQGFLFARPLTADAVPEFIRVANGARDAHAQARFA